MTPPPLSAGNALTANPTVTQSSIGQLLNSSVLSKIALAKNGLEPQVEMFGVPFAQYRIYKAKNGHVVQLSRGDGAIPDTWVVPEDQDPFDVARAALVAANLEGV